MPRMANMTCSPFGAYDSSCGSHPSVQQGDPGIVGYVPVGYGTMCSIQAGLEDIKKIFENSETQRLIDFQELKDQRTEDRHYFKTDRQEQKDQRTEDRQYFKRRIQGNQNTS
eukprot:scaffold26276_cov55-Attheya_sp.AAC.7